MGWQDAGIEAVTGKFGGGKSYWVTLQLVRHFLRGGYCGGNLALKWENIKRHAYDVHRKKLQDRQWIPLTDEQVSHFPDYIPASRDKLFPVHLALDECGIFFNSDGWKTLDPRIKEFLPQPRKYGIRVIAIVQEFHRMVVNIREQAAIVHRFRDLNKMPYSDKRMGFKNPLNGRFVELLPWFVHSAFDYKDMSADGKLSKTVKPLLNERLRKDARIYDLYDSYHTHGGTKLNGEVAGRIELETVGLVEIVKEKYLPRVGGLYETLKRI